MEPLPHQYTSPLSVLNTRQGRQVSSTSQLKRDLTQATTGAGLRNESEFGAVCVLPTITTPPPPPPKKKIKKKKKKKKKKEN